MPHIIQYETPVHLYIIDVVIGRMQSISWTTSKEYNIKLTTTLFHFIVVKLVLGISNKMKHFEYKLGVSWCITYSELFHTQDLFLVTHN